MDLLRLVLARQPASRLAVLPRLFRSRQFVALRESVHDIKHKEDDPLLNSALAGDLSPEIHGPLSWKDILARSCFLCNWGMFQHFALEVGLNMDFWYAIGTGVPEIQDYAIEKMKITFTNVDPRHHRSFIDQLYRIEDEGTLPWTPELKTKIRDMVHHIMRKVPNMLDLIPGWLYGVAEVDLKANMPNFSSYRHSSKQDYVISMVRSILDFKSANSVSKRVDKVLKKYDFETKLNARSEFDLYMRMGYSILIFLALENLTIYTRQMAINVVRDALGEVDYQILLYLCNHGYASEVEPQDGLGVRHKWFITREKVENARKCLDDPHIRQLMGPDLLTIYRTISGEVFSDSGSWNRYRIPVANPGVSVGNEISYGSISIQGIVMYDPEWLFNLENGVAKSSYVIAATYSAARGNVLLYYTKQTQVIRL